MPVSAIHPRANHPEPVRCSPALAQAARQAVMGAAAASFPSEPLLDPALSRLVSTCSSIVKRHGPLVESAIAEALVEGGLDVWQRIKVPFTRTALAFVASSDYALNRDRLLTFDPNDIAGHFDADVLAVDDPGAWACALQVRRGGGATEPVKRRRMEREIRAVDLTLASWLRQQGFLRIELSAVALVDWLGQAGFANDLVLHGDDLDNFLDVPATAKINAMSDALRHELDGRMNDLLRPVMAALDRDRNVQANRAPNHANGATEAPDHAQRLAPRPRVIVRDQAVATAAPADGRLSTGRHPRPAPRRQNTGRL